MQDRQNARALVVDDSCDGADSLVQLLHLQGYEARALYRPEGLVGEALSFQPDMIFLDLMMPGLSGIEAARRIRRERALERVWLIALTGSQEMTELREAFNAGIDGYYLKPIDPPALIALLTLSSQDRTAIGFVLGPKLTRTLARTGMLTS